MRHYIHHVPGRLRLRIPSLKGSAERAERLAAQIEQCAGVDGVRANAVTGSLLIHYDSKAFDSEALFELLRAQGIACDAREIRPTTRPVATTGTALSAKISDKVVDKFIETLVERSAVALFVALS